MTDTSHPTPATGERIHLIGVCGTAMATLAALLKRRGAEVTGSDANVYPPMSDFLAAEGIPILEGYDAERIDGTLDTVIVGNAISRGNVELEAVLDRKVRYTSLPEAIRDRFLWNSRSIVIAGTHGKTTTTAMAGWLLTHGGVDPTVFVGGIARNLGDGGSSFRLGRRDGAFVIEGDEYDSAYFDKTAKFLKYVPDVAVINNVEFDHADIYPDLEAVLTAFRRLVNIVPRRGLLLVGADSPAAREVAAGARSRVETFGLAPDAVWRAVDLVPERDGMTFTVHRDGVAIGRWHVPLGGEHNVRNALAAIAIGIDAEIPAPVLQEGLASFLGVKRRLEKVGTARGVTVYDDFAHHPTAVAETLAGVRAAWPDARLWAIFEPRSASSCRRVFQHDFARAFGPADRVIIASVYRSSLPPGERLSEDALVGEIRAAGGRADHLPDVDAIIEAVAAEAQAGDLIVVMSNGGFGGIHGRLLGRIDAGG